MMEYFYRQNKDGYWEVAEGNDSGVWALSEWHTKEQALKEIKRLESFDR